jgi:hypothetical protein
MFDLVGTLTSTGRYNLARIFPKEPTITREDASTLCNGLLDLRSRVAHHD